MRSYHLKISAIVFLLALFIAGGAAVLSHDDVKKTPNNDLQELAGSFYSRSLNTDTRHFENFRANSLESRAGGIGFVIWLVGVPLGTLAGFAIGLIVAGRSMKHYSVSQRKTSYVLLNPPAKTELFKTVSEPAVVATQRDTRRFNFDDALVSAKKCRTRFQSAMALTRRENHAG